jgi:hypothetical protein
MNEIFVSWMESTNLLHLAAVAADNLRHFFPMMPLQISQPAV